MSEYDVFDRPLHQMLRDVADRTDEWIMQQAKVLGMTVEQLAEVYYLEYDTVDVRLDGTDLRTTNTARLVRRDNLPRYEESDMTDPDWMLDNPEILAALERAWDEGQGAGTVAAINFTPLEPNPYRAKR